MRICSKCKVEKTLECFGKASKHKCGLRYDCKACQAKYRKDHFQKNKERQLEQGRKWKSDNKEQALEYSKQWARDNKDKRCSYEMNRHALKVATNLLKGDEWNDFFIQEIYNQSKVLSEETGIKWEVDHIVPLQGEQVTGLHVWNNLQLLPASINRSKKNSF